MNFGTHLREAREKRGIQLRQIATSTRISDPHARGAREQRDQEAAGRHLLARVRPLGQRRRSEWTTIPDEAVREFVHQFPLEHVTAGTKSANDRVVAHGEEGVRRRQQQVSLAVTLAILIPNRRARRLLRRLEPPLERRRRIGRSLRRPKRRVRRRRRHPLERSTPEDSPGHGGIQDHLTLGRRKRVQSSRDDAADRRRQ